LQKDVTRDADAAADATDARDGALGNRCISGFAVDPHEIGDFFYCQNRRQSIFYRPELVNALSSILLIILMNPNASAQTIYLRIRYQFPVCAGTRSQSDAGTFPSVIFSISTVRVRDGKQRPA
jgi:hypothetical protein